MTYSISSLWIRPDMTLRILSLSINTVLCIIAIISSNSSLFSNFFPVKSQRFDTTTQSSHYNWDNIHFVIWTSFSRLECDLLSMLFCCGQATSQIQIFLSTLSPKIKSGLLAVVLFCKWNLKSHTSFALSIVLQQRSSIPFLLIPDSFLIN